MDESVYGTVKLQTLVNAYFRSAKKVENLRNRILRDLAPQANCALEYAKLDVPKETSDCEPKCEVLKSMVPVLPEVMQMRVKKGDGFMT